MTLKVSNRQQVMFLATNKIYYISKLGRKTLFYTKDGMYWTYSAMDDIVSQIDSNMFQCHRNLFVNLKFINSVFADGLVLANGVKLTMCRSALQQTKKAWLLFIG